MQANRFRSMVEAKLNSHKTEFKFEIANLNFMASPYRIHRGMVYVVLLWVLIVGPRVLFAQQSQPAQPCSTQPCAELKITSGAAKPINKRFSKTLVDERIPNDPALERLTQPYSAKVHALETTIGKLEGDLIKSEVGAGTLGNFVADAIRAQSGVKLGKPVLLAITNSGGLRKNTIAEGKLRAADIFELLPFENALIEIDLTGEQLLKLLSGVVTRDAQSGAVIRYRLNAQKKPELVSAKLLEGPSRENDIDPKATYTIVTIDYLLNLASGNYSILQQGRNARPLGVTLRDAVTNYVKAETAAGRPIKARLDGRFVSVDSGDAKPEWHR